MKTIAEFNTRFLEPVMRFADHLGEREALIGMQIIPAKEGGVLLAASNGHVAIIARDPVGKLVGFNPVTFVPEQSLVMASLSHANHRFILTDTGLGIIAARRALTAGESQMDTCHAAGKACLIKGGPPDIVGTFPLEAAVNIDSTPSFCVNAAYVGLFSDSFSAMAGLERDGWEGVELRCESPVTGYRHRKIVVMPTTSHVEAAGLIMNMDASPVAYTKEWMRPKAKPRVRVAPGGRFVA